ncbi:uncharacterized protein TIGR03905 [Desulfofundulus australicus DSM 11792]|uniref:ribonucleoside-diphosphate reductase n=1 Tax=Desulfofundulus australicus DSM 11792 TaxID=1121425 RepID=A0A1M4ZAR0_9FIRM|nr:uncharacterized protein TIGR03905 [Desulfofundulus australicus DSM 11792]
MYIYKTRGICPPEIHFQLTGNTLTGVRFVGGGCRGNAQLISRLLEGREIDEVLPLLKGIQCRNNTSCPDQLFQAIQLAREGKLREEEPIAVYEVPVPYRRVAVLAEVNGNAEALRLALRQPVEAVFCLGNLTGPAGDNDGVVELARRKKLIFVQGPFDRTLPCTRPENREFLRRAPLYLRFQLGRCRVLGFYGGFIQELDGFSDYAPYSLELLMVSNLSDYLRNESVYPALEAMTGQFSVDVVLFASTNEWKHVRLGKVDFINVGPLKAESYFKYALIEWAGEELCVSFEVVKA